MKRRAAPAQSPAPIDYRPFDLVFIAGWLFAGFLVVNAMGT